MNLKHNSEEALVKGVKGILLWILNALFQAMHNLGCILLNTCVKPPPECIPLDKMAASVTCTEISTLVL